MADFPTAIFAPRTVSNLPGVSYDATQEKIQYAEDFTLPAAEIVAIETILGLNPQGAFDTVSERIAALEAGGVATWGGITGVLSDQTDLQAALDLLVVSVGTSNIGGSTNGLLFIDGDGILNQNNSFLWDNFNGFLGVNATPSFTLDIGGDANVNDNYYANSYKVGNLNFAFQAVAAILENTTLSVTGDLTITDLNFFGIFGSKALFFSVSTAYYCYWDDSQYVLSLVHGAEGDAFISDDTTLLSTYTGQGTNTGLSVTIARGAVPAPSLMSVLASGHDANNSDITGLGTLSSGGGSGSLGYADNGFTNLFIEHVFDPGGQTAIEMNLRQLSTGSYVALDWINGILNADDGSGAATPALSWIYKENLQFYSGDAGNAPVDAVTIQKFIQVLDSAGTVFFLPLYQ